jgi:hypothetical protein
MNQQVRYKPKLVMKARISNSGEARANRLNMGVIMFLPYAGHLHCDDIVDAWVSRDCEPVSRVKRSLNI